MQAVDQPGNHPIYRYDAIVIGGGVVGCAMLRALAGAGISAALLEKGADILSGASKANSAILHTGFDAPANSLELACMQSGYQEYLSIHQALNLPVLKTGALLVAWTPEELAKLPTLLAKAHQNGVRDVVEIDRDTLLREEPALSSAALGALKVPGEYLIDPWSSPLAYVLQAIHAGAKVHRDTEVISGVRIAEGWQLHTSQGLFQTKLVINCAGNQGDIVEAICRPSPFHITPRKGQFVVFDKTAASLAKHILLPVPNDRTKGIVITRTVFGNLLVGPTAEDQTNRTHAELTTDALQQLATAGERMLPALADEPITATYAGLRPASQFKDYQIEALPSEQWISVAGIRSTGLSAALGIAKHVLGLVEQHFFTVKPTHFPVWPQMPMLSDYHPRDYQTPESGKILCHCELVTQREVENALSGVFPAGDLGGLKRRTRACMGRCQGFYCQANLVELAQKTGLPMGQEAHV
ncbi:NAD(P)/FAD-dependent oxidoreductase [Leeia sp. TBRC 13508]|uniref:NAD(P)/FAD-dependent oxidoreductase n=1 Tax=Leeia speluncae TaxID=2884804 RepID=A0ABS8D3W0_9NEIS|nr:NAD(P)/FAD-dependent oxidoreductase [Leeia speluncae]MCB6182880.1 NAD(P)/FAD-dependent oxidoreductase [Leeia speluncae]